MNRVVDNRISSFLKPLKKRGEIKLRNTCSLINNLIYAWQNLTKLTRLWLKEITIHKAFPLQQDGLNQIIKILTVHPLSDRKFKLYKINRKFYKL